MRGGTRLTGHQEKCGDDLSRDLTEQASQLAAADYTFLHVGLMTIADLKIETIFLYTLDAWQGEAWLGKAGHGTVGQGKARASKTGNIRREAFSTNTPGDFFFRSIRIHNLRHTFASHLI
jgi:hypothetical protein